MSQSLSQREQIRRKEKSKRRKKWLTFGLISMAVIIIFVLIVAIPRLITKANRYQESNGFTLGNPDAPLKVEIFSSFSCSHCKTFSENEEKTFIAKYVDTGKVFYRYFNLPPSDEQSILASSASYCAADQNRFFDYKARLYEYAFAQNGFSRENLIKYAGFIGLDTDQFTSCLDSDTYAQAYLEDRVYASEAGITYTPSFLINGRIYTSAELDQAIDSLLAD